MSKPAVPKNASIHAEVDSRLLKQVSQALSRQGLTVPRAIQLMMEYVAIEGGLPLDFLPPNAETVAAMEAGRRGEVSRADSMEAFMAALQVDDADD